MAEEQIPDRSAAGASPPEQREVDGEAGAGKMLPVWFFVGIIFVVYGIIIFITGLLELHSPPATVLAAELHPTIWWGAILIGLGSFFTAHCGPWRR